MIVSSKRVAGACLLLLCACLSAGAQVPPSEPIVLGDGVLTLGGNLSATVGPDDPGFFNYTDYEDSLLRMLRLDVTAALRTGRHLAVLAELRSQNVDTPQAYALYLRIRPWAERRFDIQIGRIPPTFGAFPRRSYEADNPLIGYPLAYQYLTSLRPDAVPANIDELLQMRGRGWLASYSIGDPSAAPGVPLVSALRWDTGIQAHAEYDLIDLTGSITTGTLSNPRFSDDNTGRQVAGRAALRPIAGLLVGASVAHGPFVSRAAARDAVGSEQDGAFAQTAWGGDVEYSRGYYVIRLEAVISQWRLPGIDDRLRSIAASLEGRYKIAPGLYVAARADRLGFSEVTGTRGSAAWDAPITRVEAGGGYSFRRNLLVKVAGQFDERDGGRIQRARMLSAQLVYWF